MKPSSKDERRRGIYWLVAGVIFLALMLGAWWLVVEETNEEGTHDAQLLPFFALSRCSSAPTTLFERGSATPEPPSDVRLMVRASTPPPSSRPPPSAFIKALANSARPPHGSRQSVACPTWS